MTSPFLTKAKYFEGEKILCFHGPLLYEAKCLQVEVQEGQQKYFVHYQGWNKNWDEWVTDARMMKFNAVGLQKQKELKEAFARPGGKKLKKSELQRQAYPMPESLRHLDESMSASASASTSASAASEADTSASAMAARGAGATEDRPLVSLASSGADGQLPPTPPPLLPLSAPTPPPPTPTPPPAKAVAAAAAAAASQKRPAAPMPRLRVSLALPERLQNWLADDHDLVNNQCKLLRLPAGQHNVLHVTSDFVSAGGRDAEPVEARREFAAGLVAFFNAALGTRLLYKFERPQFAALLKTQRSPLPAGVYGAAHLLRLFACLPDLLPVAGLPYEPAGRLLADCEQFLAFLDQTIDNYLSVDCYEIASPDYQRQALCI